AFNFGLLAEKFHVTKGKSVVWAVINRCRECNAARGRPFTTPIAPLPESRTTPTQTPFTVIGLDYCGPFRTSDGKKVWCMFAVCATTRAIHLEPVTSLATGNCLMALQRLFARRGIPQQIYSDNATYFHATNNTLGRMVRAIRECSDLPEVRQLHIRWHFQPPYAPWWGGFFERFVGSVKRALNFKLIRRAV